MFWRSLAWKKRNEGKKAEVKPTLSPEEAAKQAEEAKKTEESLPEPVTPKEESVLTVIRKKHNPPYLYECLVDRVIDGDTIDLLVDLGFKTMIHLRVRLYGVDTPELNSRDEEQRKLAKLAKRYVQKQCPEGSTVYLYAYKTGKYGRWLGTVFNDADAEKSINDLLIDEKLARAY